MAKSDSITVEMVREILDYNPETGEFRWKVNRNGFRGKAKAGSVAGSPNTKGNYLTIGVFGVRVYAHRLAWFLTHGVWPGELDHVDRNGWNNSISNLRECNRSQNNQNQGARKRDLPPGVYPVHRGGRFRASICLDNKQMHLGCFDTPGEAHAAYMDAKKNLHPFAVP